MGFREYNLEQASVPVRGPFGLALADAIGEQQDAELALLRTALLCHLPARCPDDGLDALGRHYQIERYAGESHPSYRARLVNAWQTWETAGTAAAIEAQVRAFGVPDVLVQEDHEIPGAWPGTMWPRFRVRLGPDLGALSLNRFYIGTHTIGGGVPIGGPHVDAAQRRALKGIARKWKAAHSYPVDILVWESGTLIGESTIGDDVIGGDSEQIFIGRLIGKNIVVGSTPIGGYDVS